LSRSEDQLIECEAIDCRASGTPLAPALTVLFVFVSLNLGAHHRTLEEIVLSLEAGR